MNLIIENTNTCVKIVLSGKVIVFMLSYLAHKVRLLRDDDFEFWMKLQMMSTKFRCTLLFEAVENTSSFFFDNFVPML